MANPKYGRENKLPHVALVEFIDEAVTTNQYEEIIDLRIQGLQYLPPQFGLLKRARVIILSNNKLSYLPETFAKLENLEELDIHGNNFLTFPEEILSLKKLKKLNISDNQIAALPGTIGELKRLQVLIANENKITSLPPTIAEIKELERLNLQDNSLPIPPEILKKTDKPYAILAAYFESYLEVVGGLEALVTTEEKVKIIKSFPLQEAKALLVGQGSVGKTSLVQQILHGTFDQNQTKTEGISINQWQVEGSEKRETEGQSESEIQNRKSEIKLNIWDFGGQEIMHATHQFFLTKRSLYLLVLDARLTQEENRVEYWLKIIQSFGGESPVLIDGNKTDQHPLDIDRTGLQKKYPNIVGILETSAATGAGIVALKAEIAKQVNILPHVRDQLPETWFTVKSKLEELGRDKNFITQDEYLALCGANEVTDEISQHTLIGFLLDLGVVLHFQDDPRLEALGILNPQWVTNGVYKILNSHELFQNQGTLTLPILNKTLNPPEYPSNKRLFIVDMMKKFELCYDIELDKSFLIPDLLPKDEIYTGEWDDALAFQYHYNVLPSSIISRFIVRMNAFIHKNTIWRSGVVLKRGDNNGLVKADTEDRKIYIWVNGKENTRRDLLAMIRGEFDAIHKTIAKIEAAEKVPLPNAPEADPVDLTFLQRAASEGRESLPVQIGNRILDVIVKEVLSQIEKDGRGNITINIGGNVGGSFILGDENTSTTDTKDETK
jgi:internalin A